MTLKLIETSDTLSFLPVGITYNDRLIYCCDNSSNIFYSLDSIFNILFTSQPFDFTLHAICFANGRLYGCNTTDNKILCFTLSGLIIQESADLGYAPRGITSDGRFLFVTDSDNSIVYVYDYSFKFITLFVLSTYAPDGICFDGRCFLAENLSDNKIIKFDKNFNFITILLEPDFDVGDLCFDGRCILITDTVTNTIKKYTY